MLLRAVRLAVVGAAVLLALHLFMLIGHGHGGHGSMPSPGAMPHATAPMDQQMGSTIDLDAGPGAGVDMAATCFAVLAGLLFLSAGACRGSRTTAFAASMGRLAALRASAIARAPDHRSSCASSGAEPIQIESAI